MDLKDRWNNVNSLRGPDLWHQIEERSARPSEPTATPRASQRVLVFAVASIISVGAAALLFRGGWWSSTEPTRRPAASGPVASESVGTLPSDRCAYPAVSPTTLPWVADGGSLPAPEVDEINARLTWLAPEGDWSGSYVAVRLLDEANIEGQPLENAPLPDGTPGEIVHFGREWNVFWADSERYCGSIALYVFVGDRPTDESRQLAVAIAESLVERHEVIART